MHVRISEQANLCVLTNDVYTLRSAHSATYLRYEMLSFRSETLSTCQGNYLSYPLPVTAFQGDLRERAHCMQSALVVMISLYRPQRDTK